MKKISIIVPVYNVEDYLEQCLDSLVNQSLCEIEIICINDASTDNSINILKEYKEKYPSKIVLIDSPINKKQGGARNLGIEKATGEYIGFVDSDDWIDLSMYEKLYDLIKKDGSDFAQCDYYEYHGENNPLKYQFCISKHCELLTPEELHSVLVIDEGRAWCSIIKRDIMIDNDLRYPEGIVYEDCALCRAPFINSVSKLDEPLYYYRCNNISTSRVKNNSRTFDRLKAAKIMLEKYKKQGVYELYKEEIDFRFMELYYINSVSIFLLAFDNFPKNHLYEIRNYMKQKYPDYRHNKYFDTRVIKMYKVMTKINDISPSLLWHLYHPIGKCVHRTISVLRQKNRHK